MASDNQQGASTNRQKVMVGIFVVVVIIIIWQVWGLFGDSSPTPKPTATQTAGGSAMSAQQITPQPAQLAQTAVSPREAELMKAQQELEIKYIAALNELQMLKIQRDISETNKSIMSNQFDTVKSQKGIVDLLTAPPPPQIPQSAYSQGLINPGAGMIPGVLPPGNAPIQQQPTEINYLVISVSQIGGRWSAVLGLQGKLYNVYTGDVLPTDQSKVVSIDKSGVVLQDKEGKRKRVSLVSII